MQTADSTDLTPPFLGQEHPVFPQIEEILRVYAPALVGTNVYPAFIQQANGLALRDRVSVYLLEPNNVALGPGFYQGRLLTSYAGLPLYCTHCCPTGKFSSSSSSSSSSKSPILILDNVFPDANGTNLTAHTINPTNVPGTSWSTIAGSGFTIQSGVIQGVGSVGSDNYDTLDAGQANVTVTATMTLLVINSIGFMALNIRQASAGNLWNFICQDTGGTQLYETVSGTPTLRATGSFTQDLNPHVLKAVVSGSTITCYIDGIQNLTFSGMSSGAGVTKHGIRGTGKTTCSSFQVSSP